MVPITRAPSVVQRPLWAGSDDGASGVHASAPDLPRFWQMCLDGGMVGDTRVLSADAVRVMTTNQIPGIAVDLGGISKDEASWGFGFGVTGHEAWAKFGGGLSPRELPSRWRWWRRRLGRSRVGGRCRVHRVVTEDSDDGMPWSWAGHRFQDVVNAAVLDR